jgi:hypothetical protein
MAQYRKDHPEFYAKELIKRKEEIKHLYHTDEEYKQRLIDYSRRYYADPEKRAKKLARQKELRAIKKALKNIEIAGE